MKAGFLGAKPTPKQPQATQQQPAQHLPVTASDAPAQPAAAQGTVPHSQPGVLDPALNSASWQQCMELLKSGSDEKKFVGLLLVTKLLPHGTDAALQEVLDAVDWTFLQRMLLPLRQQPQQQQLSEDRLQQQQLSVSLGLSILSASARLQEAAASEELLQLMPLLAKVAAAGGVAPLFARTSLPQQQQQQQQQQLGPAAWADTAADLAAAVDALECLVACASSGNYQRKVVLESSGFAAAAAALAVAVTAQQCCQDAAALLNSRMDEALVAAAAAATAAASRAVMLSMQLLGVLLEGDAVSRGKLIEQHPIESTGSVMLLAAVFGSKAASSSTPQQGPATGSAQQQHQHQHQQGQGVDAAALQLEALHTLLSLLPLPEGAQLTRTVLTDTAEGLLAQRKVAAAAVAAAAAGKGTRQSSKERGNPAASSSTDLLTQATAAAGDWPSALRQGLVQVLRSRVGAVQRHSALQLAAAAVDLLGPAWLLPPPPQQQQSLCAAAAATTTTASSSSQDSPAEFLLVLMEVLAIETPLLLSDAVNAGAAVPKADAAMAAADPPAAAAAGAGAGDTAALEPDGADTAAVDSDGGSNGAMDVGEVSEADAAVQTLTVRQMVEEQLKQHEQEGPKQQQQQQEPGGNGWPGPPGFEQQQQHGGSQGQQQQQLKPLRQQLADLELPDDKPVGQGQQPAGARALQCLPSCYSLLESCLELLVAQVSLLEDLADLSQPDAQQTHTPPPPPAPAAAAGDSGAFVGGRVVSWQEVLPGLGVKQVEQLMTRMGQVTQVVCEFLDYATSPTAAAVEAAAPVDAWLVVGAVRLLGRFLADAPDAHEAAVRTLLPRLLTSTPTSTGRSAGTAAGKQRQQPHCTGATEAEAACGEGQQQGDAAGCASGVVLPVPVISFLLPAMLTWTSKHSSHHQEWVSFMLGADSGCVTALAAHVQDVVAAATAAAAALDAKGSVGFGGSDSLRAVEVQLGSVCQVLYQLLSGRGFLLSALAQQAGAAVPALTSVQKAALAAAQQVLCSWSAGRLRGLQQSAQQVQGLDAIAAAQSVLGKLSSSWLQLPTLLPAVALTGQLLVLLELPAAAEAAELLCWGCEVGWHVQLIMAYQQQEGVHCMSGAMQHTLQVWEVAELDEVWDNCLASSADLLTQHGSGSVFGKVLGAALKDGWLKYAMLGWGEVSTGTVPGSGDLNIAAAAAAAAEASMALPLLLQAAATFLKL